MVTLSDDVLQHFHEVLEEINNNIRALMQELWINWSHLGVDDATKRKYIARLAQIEKDLHNEVIAETRLQLKKLHDDVDKLIKETKELGRCLSIDIAILEFNDDFMLIQYKKELEDQISGYREQVTQRRMKMDRLLEWQRDLAQKLSITIQEFQEVPLPTEEELNKLKAHLEVLQAERDKRVEIFLNTQVEIKDIMEKLQIKPQNKFENTVVTSLSVDFQVNDLNMDRLAKLHQDLQEKYEDTNNRVLELRERLVKLWDCLNIEQTERDNFLSAHPGCHPMAEAALKKEIVRLNGIKRQQIQSVVETVRGKIKTSWDDVMYSNREREEFVHFYQDVFTEDTLTLHELYLEKLTKFYKDNSHIFELVRERKRLWLKMTTLEAHYSVPGRYHNRGGQLLAEEKERKILAKQLPKIEAQLRDLVTEYEQKTGNVFTIEGKPLLQLIEDDWENRKAERQNKLSARKQALTPTTPHFRSLAVSPAKRNRTAAGLAATVERNRPPTKRQLITCSATKASSTMVNHSPVPKRSAMTTVKRRISGRLAARTVAAGTVERLKRKLEYGEANNRTPKTTANGNILKYKCMTDNTKRRSSNNKRKSANATRSTNSHDDGLVQRQDPLMETSLQTTYTDFQEGIDELKICRSSLAVNNRGHAGGQAGQGRNVVPTITYTKIDENNPPKTPRNNTRTKTALTPKLGKENIKHNDVHVTPKTNLMYTPTRLTRSAVKINNEGFLTPRAPLSANKINMQRQNSVTNLTVKTPTNVSRSKSHTHLNYIRAKNLPPLI